MKFALARGSGCRRRIYFGNTRVLSFKWPLSLASWHRPALVRSLRAALGDTTLHVIGDSHTGFFSGNEFLRHQPLLPGIQSCSDRLPNFKTFHLGPSLAYQADAPHSTTGTRGKVAALAAAGHLPPGCPLLCCFGEIDLRVHVFQQTVRQSASYQTVVDAILARYLAFLLRLRDQGHPVIAWGPIATGETRFGHRIYTGTDAERNAATACFNDRLAALCREHGLGFVSIFHEMLAPDCRTRYPLLSDGCHLSQRAWPLLLPKLPDLAAFLRATPPNP